MMNLNYLLITTMDRETTVFSFRTEEDAKATMKKEFIEAGGDIEENNDYSSLEDKSAWVNDGTNHMNYDWKIVNLSEIMPNVPIKMWEVIGIDDLEGETFAICTSEAKAIEAENLLKAQGFENIKIKKSNINLDEIKIDQDIISL